MSTEATAPKLFQPIKLGGLTLPNRIVVPPMCVWLTDPENNDATDRSLVHYGAMAMGGAGLIIFEAAPVEYRGRLQPEDLGIYDDRHIAGLKKINDFIHANTVSKTAIQLGHGGRKGPLVDCFSPVPHQLGPNEKFGSEPISSSPIPWSEQYLTPVEMTRATMLEVKAAFVSAARRAVEAGFDAIELHGAHGYLLCQFSSPVSNKRTDEYGGSLENRLRFPLEVMTAVRQVMPAEMPLIVRISAVDWVDYGMTIEESIEYAKKMKSVGVDCVHVSSGGSAHDQKIPMMQGFTLQVPFSEQIKREAGIPTIAVGGIKTGPDAEEILQKDQATLVAVGRAILRDPYWPRNQAREMGVDTWYPKYQAAAYFSARKVAAAAAKAGNEQIKPTTLEA